MNESSELENISQKFRGRQGLFYEIIYFVRKTRKYWLVFFIAILMALGGILILGETGVAPFIYTAF